MPELVISKTKSQQLTGYLEDRIRSGQLKHGERLQTVRELAALFNVSTIVVNAAYDELEKKNLVERCGRRGVFVNDPKQKAKSFLIVTYSNYMQMESPATYSIPEFKAQCAMMGIRTEEVNVDFLRRGNIDELIRRFRQSAYDGALLTSSLYVGNEPEIIILRELGIPVLMPHADTGDDKTTGFDCFYSDIDGAWFELMRYLHRQGYRRIGALGTRNPKSEICRLRCGSTVQHLEMLDSLGLEVYENSICYLEYEDTEKFQRGLEEWLRNPRQFDAIMCFSDFFALRLYEYCANHGIRIPDELAVTGFCGYPGGNLLQPGLTTIDRCYREIGRMAVEFLLNGRKDTPGGINIKLTPYRLIERGSTISGKNFGHI